MIGRERELERLRAFVSGGFTPTALVLDGEPGIGKTTLWEAGIAAARERGVAVRVARAGEAEAQLSFAALIDLAGGLDLGPLPAPQRAALEIALLRREPEGAPPQPHAIGFGLRNALAAAGPTLVALDDIQWLDALSGEALAFAARRLHDVPVGFLLARRPGEATVLERALERGALERVHVGPLDMRATRRLLAERLGLEVAPSVLRRIVDATLGNPLFALEIGRLLAAGGVGEDLPVPPAVEDLLGTRVSQAPRGARRLLLAVALGSDLPADELEAIAPVDVALDAGLLVADGERVRAAHPLLAAAARANARPRERRELHRLLAELTREPEQRALHLALATADPDETLAAEVGRAAASAAARGARPEAVALAEQALRLTPEPSAAGGASPGGHTPAGSATSPPRGADSPRVERLLTLAGYLEVAGERRQVRDLLLGALDALPPGAPRVRAWVMMSDADVHSREEKLEYIERALDEAGKDAELRAHVLALKALNTVAEGVERVAEAEAWALEALPAGGDAALLAQNALAWARSLRGRPLGDLRVPETAYLVDSPEPVAGLRHSWRGELAAARSITERYLELAAERGEGVSYAWLRLNLTELELRAGNWDAAARLLDEWADTDDGMFLITPTYQRCRALLAVGRGDPAEARRWGEPALEEAAARGYAWPTLEATRALGQAALLAHEPELAAAHLRAVWEHTEREGVDEPGAFPVAGELVEALTELGQLDEANAVTERLKALAGDDHPWAHATLARCEGEHEQAAAAFEALGLRFDAARAQLAHGRALRRARRWRAARDALEGAARTFEALGSPGWAGQAKAELTRVGGRKPRNAGELTETERQVARLAAAGRSNKEIAQTLFVTVHTVEAHLSNTYAKLGVKTRTQLAAHL